MRLGRFQAWWPICAAYSLTLCVSALLAQTTNAPQSIDLPTALRLAGAQNLDVQIAKERLLEAKAIHQGTVMQFLPWIAPGAGYRRHEDRIQDVAGGIIDANKQSYTIGGSLASQWDLGDALYKSLNAKQLARAAGHALEAQRQDTTLAAAHGYFDLALTQSAIRVADEAVRIAQGYTLEVTRAFEAGIAFKGDELRVRVQAERNRLALRQSLEQHRIAAARLAQTLRLDPSVALVAAESELAPLSLVATNEALSSVLEQAFANRSELKQTQSLVAAAKDSRNGVVYGPLIPALGAQAFIGGLGGGKQDRLGSFGPTEDYAVTLGWRIGPGGLFDSSRRRAADARLQGSRLNAAKAHEEVAREVVEAFTRFHSQADQIVTARQLLSAAEKGLQLAQQRKEFGVGIVLETIQAEQDLTRARLDYLKAVAEFNKAQYALIKAAGKL